MSTQSEYEKLGLPWESERWCEATFVALTSDKPKRAFVFQTVGGNDKRNADFIVRACNTHHKALAALKAMRDVWEAEHVHDGHGGRMAVSTPGAGAAVSLANEAIAEMEGT